DRGLDADPLPGPPLELGCSIDPRPPDVPDGGAEVRSRRLGNGVEQDERPFREESIRSVAVVHRERTEEILVEVDRGLRCDHVEVHVEEGCPLRGGIRCAGGRLVGIVGGGRRGRAAAGEQHGESHDGGSETYTSEAGRSLPQRHGLQPRHYNHLRGWGLGGYGVAPDKIGDSAGAAKPDPKPTGTARGIKPLWHTREEAGSLMWSRLLHLVEPSRARGRVDQTGRAFPPRRSWPSAVIARQPARSRSVTVTNEKGRGESIGTNESEDLVFLLFPLLLFILLPVVVLLPLVVLVVVPLVLVFLVPAVAVAAGTPLILVVAEAGLEELQGDRKLFIDHGYHHHFHHSEVSSHADEMGGSESHATPHRTADSPQSKGLGRCVKGRAAVRFFREWTFPTRGGSVPEPPLLPTVRGRAAPLGKTIFPNQA